MLKKEIEQLRPKLKQPDNLSCEKDLENRLFAHYPLISKLYDPNFLRFRNRSIPYASFEFNNPEREMIKGVLDITFDYAKVREDDSFLRNTVLNFIKLWMY